MKREPGAAPGACWFAELGCPRKKPPHILVGYEFGRSAISKVEKEGQPTTYGISYDSIRHACWRAAVGEEGSARDRRRSRTAAERLIEIVRQGADQGSRWAHERRVLKKERNEYLGREEYPPEYTLVTVWDVP